MLDRLLTEQANPASRDIDQLPLDSVLRIINDEDQKVALAVQRAIPAIERAVAQIVDILRHNGRLFYIGAGTSGRLGVLDAAECPPTFNVSPDLVQGVIAGGEAALAKAAEASEDDPDAGRRDLFAHGFTGRDVLVGIAASGRTPYVLGAVAAAREVRAFTAGISCSQDSELSRSVDAPIELLVGPEVIAGSTRMKAGTATKLVLNMISTATMIALGHVYGNFMVNVQPRNEKLAERATRIIAEVIPVPIERARELLQRADGEVKTAIVMGRLGADAESARARLKSEQGILSKALKS